MVSVGVCGEGLVWVGLWGVVLWMGVQYYEIREMDWTVFVDV